MPVDFSGMVIVCALINCFDVVDGTLIGVAAFALDGNDDMVLVMDAAVMQKVNGATNVRRLSLSRNPFSLSYADADWLRPFE